MATFTVETIIEAPVSKVWSVLADIGSIAIWHPGVAHSHLLSKEANGLNASRYCDLGGHNYLKEKVVTWDVERHLTFRITSTNLPFRTADIRFTLSPTPKGTIVTVSPVYTLKFGLLGGVLDYLMVHRRYKAGMCELLSGLKQYIEGNSLPPAGQVDHSAQRQDHRASMDGSSTHLLRAALLANSAFSMTCGIAMNITAQPLTSLLGLDRAWIVAGVGGLLVVFAAILGYIARRPSAYTGLVMTAVVLDVVWVVGTGLLIAIGVFNTTGVWVTALIAEVVLVFAMLQALGLRQVQRQVVT